MTAPPSEPTDLARRLRDAEETIRTLERERARLRESDERLRRTLDQLEDGVVVFDADLRTRYANAATCFVTGRSLADLLGRRADELWPVEIHRLFLPALLRARQSGQIQEVEVELPVATGGHRTFAIMYAPLRDAQGNVREVLGTSHDITKQRRGEAALRERAALGEQLAKIGESVPGLICSYELRADGTARMPFCTRAAEDVYGITPAELRKNMSAWAVNVPAAELERVNAGIAAAAVGPTPWHDVFQYNHPTKGPRWLEGWSIPTTQTSDGTLVWHGFVMDVTDRKRAEQHIERLSRLYRTLADTNEAIVRATSEQELFQRACDAVLGLGGVNMARIAIHDPDRAVLAQRAFAGDPRFANVPDHPLDPAHPRGNLPGVRAFRDNVTVVENDDLRKTWLARAPGLEHEVPPWILGALRSAIGLPLRSGGKPVGVLVLTSSEPGYFDPEVVALLEALAQDISFGLDHLARARELQRSEERYRALVDNLEHVVYTTDLEGRFTFVNEAATRFGLTPKDVIGRRLYELVHPQDLELVGEQWMQVMSGLPVVFEARAIDGAGETRFVRVHARWIQEGGKTTGTQGVLMDLTRLRETEEQLRMSQKMEAIGRLAGGVAHDFNNLLMVITSYTDLAIESLPPDHLALADLAAVRGASERASALTKQLLAFSRKQVLQPRVIDVNVLVDGLRRMLERLLGEDVALVVERGADLCSTKADPGQLEQVLMNLAVNARDAMPDGGVLRIATSNAELDAEQATLLTGAKPGSYVCISVSDDGTGMDAVTQARVFEPFFTTKPAGQGTGLGLAMAYGIVKQSGGYISLASAPGRGTTFDIYLPQAIPSEADGAAAPAPATTARGKETVLLVEDESAVRQVISRILTKAGYNVLSASGGAEALELCRRHRGGVRLVVTDVVMPGMNGRELARQLVAVCPNITVLYTSGYTDDAIASRGVLDPGTHFIPKPFTAIEILAKVRSVLDGV